MSVGALPEKTKEPILKSSTLVMWAFVTAFFSRILDSVGLPSAVNFLHFATIPFVFGVALLKARPKDSAQIKGVYQILTGLFILLIVTTASGLLNNAGLINVVLQYLLLAEPFMLLLALVTIPMAATSVESSRTWIIRFGILNTALAWIQRFVLRLHLRRGAEDNIKGVFIGQKAGHVVGGAVALTFGAYFLVAAKDKPLWMRIAVAVATFVHMMIADAKQVMAVFAAAFVLLLFTKLKDPAQAIKYLIIVAIVIYGSVWTFFNVFTTWSEDLALTAEGMKLKWVGFPIIISYFHSPLNWWLGLGPGHTIGRLGGWMIPSYKDLLEPLGVTTSPASQAVWNAVASSYFGDKSSMFSPLV
ncbi:hypothetical protein [Leptothermofonsia sp. ETS-13]|uniref:hypothetical protein n=1 Tax=Leptothermofonsia sp. ETS-13 TaxID=3035696 RepID=UPI003B9F586A